ncbi:MULTISPECIES: GNAT family N-acetyltransferase [unclassified Paenibacillus]|uniref:GNAT family N-acetyltransferase n=1 Tax=unclassified Paenibacillus TaxID=185978 RepID=UPI002406E24F|nr:MULTISPECIES: GNAT family N-acetyltransferase [unclassified Paenibacillus]MDF9841203.1 RimJ/RimL family protein N-acetyltransferase [Paenibacillus sp. PastF-2]MDF9847625.1 RimJ/RimL family protein N-acetyltransferase [Paenibacillus sp. PastM-2]MDF9854194.1 RimJ/RimL family protein N-acetyltransferase [Paenibacillus sp. PastF-1]MDH6479635.1 RimJ/RimL family protein N-acetyltransferase [Paenibacillus sp. PastH-2]MDH6505300.1 RimJ/RimL family protein N-acetyltransferase [Paenibacillus sp. Past
MNVLFRKLVPEDAGRLLSLQHSLDEETAFMLLEPDERQTSVQQVRELIESKERSVNSILIAAEADGELAGYISVSGRDLKRIRHCAYIVIGIRQAFQGLGIGSGLFREMEAWARISRIVRLELTVMAHNERGIALYKKCGFEIEGMKKKSLYIDGEWIDEYYMGKILD